MNQGAVPELIHFPNEAAEPPPSSLCRLAARASGFGGVVLGAAVAAEDDA